MGAQWINRKGLTQKFVNRHLSAAECQRVVLAVALTAPGVQSAPGVESTTKARESELAPVTGTALKEDNISLKPGVCKLAML